MNCKALINNFLHDYHTRKLPVARRLEFEFHLALCRACRRYVDAYKTTVLLAKQAESDLPGNPPAELVEMILQRAGQRK